MNIATPGVFTQEISKLPPSVAGVATAIPAFLGFTEKSGATVNHTLPEYAPEIERIVSMLEYEEKFGGPFAISYTVKMNLGGSGDEVKAIDADYRLFLYDTVRMYFENGGGPCYIVSLGDYIDVQGDGGTISAITTSELIDAYEAGLDGTDKVDEITLLLSPDALIQKAGVPFLETRTPSTGVPTSIDASNYGSIANTMITHCSNLKDRFCVLDAVRGYEKEALTNFVINGDASFDGFRSVVNGSNYAASYYPWLRSTIFDPLQYSNIKFIDNTTLAPYTLATSALIDNVDALIEAKDKIREAIEINTTTRAFDGPVTLASMKAYFDERKAEYLTSSAAAAKANFTNLMLYLANVAKAFEELLAVAPAIADELAVAKADLLLRHEIIKYCELFVDAATYTGPTPGIINTGGLATLSGALDGTDWIVENPPALPYATIAAISGEITFAFVGADGGEERDLILAYLESGDEINLDKLFGSLANIYAAAEYKCNLATSILFEQHPVFNAVWNAHGNTARLQPAQGAVAGVYADTDRVKGVWKAPANAVLSGVVGPAVMLSNAEQDGLNIDPVAGKSVNAIRTFNGRGTLVWGARTLEGNSNEWRYVPVRRFFIFAEESIKKATQVFVFEPNNGSTWVKVKAMITNFLIDQWKAGALLGNRAEDAFFVKVGLGETMTEQDILEGKMIVEVGMAAVRPAEFIILKFTHFVQD